MAAAPESTETIHAMGRERRTLNRAQGYWNMRTNQFNAAM
jgi:ribosomal protein L20